MRVFLFFKGGEQMKLKIHGDIIDWNDSIIDFQNSMKGIDENEELEVDINSLGGDVFLGISIANTIRGHKGKTTTVISGIAASAASIIATASDSVKMYSSSQLMVHNVWTLAMGNSKDLRKVADDLEKIGESVLASYTHRVDEKTVKDLLDAETYLTAKESKEYGFADVIIDENPKAVQSKVFADLAKKFNDKLSTEKPTKPIPSATVNIDEETLKQMFTNFKDEIKNDLQQQNNKPPESEPTQKNMSKLFLNL